MNGAGALSQYERTPPGRRPRDSAECWTNLPAPLTWASVTAVEAVSLMIDCPATEPSRVVHAGARIDRRRAPRLAATAYE